MRVVLLKDGVVANVIVAAEGYVVPDGYEIGAPDGEIGDIWDGSAYAKHDEASSDQTALLNHLAALRWERERAGVDFNGTLLPTDRERRSALKDAADKMRDGTLTEPIAISFSATAYATVTLAQLDAAIAAITVYVQAVFSHALAIASQIESGTITTRAQLLAAWDAE